MPVQRKTTRRGAKGGFDISVHIPEKLFFDIVDLLREPKSLIPANRECVVGMDRRDRILDALLQIRREVVQDSGRPVMSGSSRHS